MTVVFYSVTIVAEWISSRALDPRVVSYSPGRFLTCVCVSGQNNLLLIIYRVLSDRTLKKQVSSTWCRCLCSVYIIIYIAEDYNTVYNPDFQFKILRNLDDFKRLLDLLCLII